MVLEAQVDLLAEQQSLYQPHLRLVNRLLAVEVVAISLSVRQVLQELEQLLVQVALEALEVEAEAQEPLVEQEALAVTVLY